MKKKPSGVYLSGGIPERLLDNAVTLTTHPAWADFCAWLASESAKLDERALADANPHACGAALVLRDLLCLLDASLDRKRDLQELERSSQSRPGAADWR